MKVVVGLGNPGDRYAGTRHNVGFEVIDYLAAGADCSAFRSRFQAQVAELREAGEVILLVKPETFMNLSGQCVRAVIDFYKVSAEDLLVVCDDFNLPLGKLRARSKGSPGGQNGLKSVEEQLGTDAYSRLRIGVGSPRGDAVDHVLGRFKAGERAVVEEAVHDAGDGVLIWVRDGIEACMNRVNGKDADKKKPSES